MLQYLERSELDHLPISLSDAQITDPYSVLEDLCSDFSLGQIRNTITEMVEICLTIEDEIFRETRKRADALYISRKIQQAIEAVFLIINQRPSSSES